MVTDVDLKAVEEFVKSDKFTQFLVSNTTDIGIPMYILQTLFDAIEQDSASLDIK